MDPKEAIEYIDENTIGVMVILGSTYTGGFEDVKGMNDLRKFLNPFVLPQCLLLL